MQQWTWVSQCIHSTWAARHRCLSSGDLFLSCSLSSEAAQVSYTSGCWAIQNKRTPGKNNRQQLCEGQTCLHRCTQVHTDACAAKCSLIAKQTGQTGFTTLHLCGGFRGWYSWKSCKLQMFLFLSVEHMSTYFYCSYTSQIDLSSWLCEGVHTVTDWHLPGSHINLAAPAPVETLTLWAFSKRMDFGVLVWFLP